MSSTGIVQLLQAAAQMQQAQASAAVPTPAQTETPAQPSEPQSEHQQQQQPQIDEDPQQQLLNHLPPGVNTEEVLSVLKKLGMPLPASNAESVSNTAGAMASGQQAPEPIQNQQTPQIAQQTPTQQPTQQPTQSSEIAAGININGVKKVLSEYSENLKDMQGKYESAIAELKKYKERSQKQKEDMVQSAMQKLRNQLPDKFRENQTMETSIQSLASGILKAGGSPDSPDDSGVQSALQIIEAVASANSAQTSALQAVYKARQELVQEATKLREELKNARASEMSLKERLQRLQSQTVDPNLQFEQKADNVGGVGGGDDNYNNILHAAKAMGIPEDSLRRLYEASNSASDNSSNNNIISSGSHSSSPLEAPQVVQAVASGDPDADFFKMFEGIDTNALANQPVRDFFDKDFLANLGKNA